MQNLVSQHDFVDGFCRWCGGRTTSEFTDKLLTCVPRLIEAAPRPVPTSIFADLGSVGDRMREIQAEEAADSEAPKHDTDQPC